MVHFLSIYYIFHFVVFSIYYMDPHDVRRWSCKDPLILCSCLSLNRHHGRPQVSTGEMGACSSIWCMMKSRGGGGRVVLFGGGLERPGFLHPFICVSPIQQLCNPDNLWLLVNKSTGPFVEAVRQARIAGALCERMNVWCSLWVCWQYVFFYFSSFAAISSFFVIYKYLTHQDARLILSSYQLIMDGRCF